MKQLNFTCKEKLSYLLKLKQGDELQTIRKAWYDSFSKRQGITDDVYPNKQKYSVGDIVEIFWNLGNKIKDIKGMTLLGNIKILEVFKIEINKTTESYKDTFFIRGKDIEPDGENLANHDGFKSAEEMFKYFDKNYDLSTPKKFYVYRGIVQ